ncbi:MAG: hypothetical protein ACPGYY_06240, partial [Bacteroidia bacterium]
MKKTIAFLAVSLLLFVAAQSFKFPSITKYSANETYRELVPSPDHAEIPVIDDIQSADSSQAYEM